MRYLDDLTPIERYLELKDQRAAIDAELNALKPLITAALMEEDGEQYEFSGFRFSLHRRKSYAYSDHVKALEQQLRALKKQEERNGMAELVKQNAYPVVKAAS
ncbi:MAG: hypothetical protein AAGJ10_03200 [Bacteroidota bacterium]